VNVAICIGIDPGSSSGGIAVVNATGSDAQCWPLGNLTLSDIWSVVSMAPDSGRVFGVIERVSAMPKQGVSSTFKFGKSAGALEMALVAAGVEYELVTPTKWQAAMKCRSGGNKNITKAAAQRLFPALKITHLVADAILLAEFARRLAVERGMID